MDLKTIFWLRLCFHATRNLVLLKFLDLELRPVSHNRSLGFDQTQKSKKILEKILKDVPFAFVKSLKKESRVADIFLTRNQKEPNPQKVADSVACLD